MWADAGRRLLLALLVLLRVTHALFEDEVGQYEWQVQHVGKPTALAYSADSSDRVLVASASGVVASVLLKDGSIQWRRIAADEPITALRSGSKVIVSATASGLVQGWKPSNGDLTWQREYSDKIVELLLAGPSAKQSVIVVREGEVEARSVTGTGKVEWAVQANAVGPSARFLAAAGAVAESALCAVAVTAGGTAATAVKIEADGGKIAKKFDLPSGSGKTFESGNFIIVDNQFVSLAGDTVTTHPLCGEDGGDSYDLSKVKSSGSAPFWLLPWQRTAGVFAVTNGVTTAIFGLSSKGLKQLRTFDGQAVVGPVFSVHEDEGGQPVAVAMVKDEGTQIQLLDPASGNVQPAIHAADYTATDHGPAELLLVRELSSGEHRTVISASDHSMAGIHGAKVVWSREEALASIRHAFIYGRPLSAAAPKAPVAALSTQLLELPGRFAELLSSGVDIGSILSNRPKQRKTGSLISMMPNTKLPSSGDELRKFGADKLVIAVTKASKVFALEVTSSEVIWQRYLGVGEASAECKNAADDGASTVVGTCNVWAQLLAPKGSGLSELFIVAPKQGGGGHQILWLDPLTGSTLQQESVQYAISTVMELPRKGGRRAGQVHPVLVIDENRAVHTLPAGSEDAAQLLAESTGRLFHYEVDRANSVVHGFVIGKAEERLFPLWNLELGSIGEKILTSATPAHREWDHVPVYIKGDASILYKYMNRNLLAVASVDNQHKGNMSSLNLYSMDAVTGHVLHQSRIVGGAAPVNLVACDNWVVMHYWNVKKTRFELTVIELFQAKADDGPWPILFGQSQINQTKSAHYLDTPVPLQQTYISLAGVTTMGVTATLKGITPRSLLLALTTDHLFRVSKDQLNPRRPYPSGSKDDIPSQFAPTKEEGTPPYAPVMPLRPTDVLTHYNTMSRVRGIVSSPSGLESTSLVFAYGLDLFFCPVQTAKAYDVLSPGFNYKLLFVSVAIVIAVFVVTSYLASWKTLQERWK